MHTNKLHNDHLEIAEKVRSGEYFNEALTMYDTQIHDPMADRYWFVLLTALSVLIAFVSLIAINGLFPLKRSVPFIYSTNDIVDDLPRMKSLFSESGQDPSQVLLYYMLKNYVGLRESYDIETFDRNISGIKSQSTEEVFKEYQDYIDPRNEQSPVTLYQRHSRRSAEVISIMPVGEAVNEIEIVYDASVVSKTDVKKSRWIVNITFDYNGIVLDTETDKVKPVQFLITKYRARRIES